MITLSRSLNTSTKNFTLLLLFSFFFLSVSSSSSFAYSNDGEEIQDEKTNTNDIENQQTQTQPKTQFVTVQPSNKYKFQNKLGLVPCVHTENGVHYNMENLRNLRQDYFIPAKNHSNEYPLKPGVWVNLCTPLVMQLCGNAAGACQVWDLKSFGGRANLGSSNFLLFHQMNASSFGSGLVATYEGGSEGRSFTTYLICNQNIDVGYPEYLGETGNETRKYEFVWHTRYACPWYTPNNPSPKPQIPEGVRITGFILIVFASFLLIYFLGGSLLRRFVLHKQGWEILPNYSLWYWVGDKIKTFAIYLVSCGKRKYTELPADDDEEEASR